MILQLKINKKLAFPSFLLAIGLLFLSGCTERGHNNPFDPQSSGNSPLTISVISDDNSTIQLNWSWRSDPVTDFIGFRIYRSAGNNQNFILYRDLPKNRFSFIDSTVQKYDWFYYKVSVYGPSVESAASQPEKIYLGQGFYWLLSTYGFWVRKVSYDLLHSLKNYYTTYPAEEWAVSLGDSLINLAFFRYSKGVSQLNLNKGTEDFFYFTNSNYPIDVEYDESQNRIYFLEENTSGNSDQLVILKNEALETKIPLPAQNYLKLYLSIPNQSLIILGESKYLEYSINSSVFIDSVMFSSDFIAKDMDVSNDSVFVLTSSQEINMSRIYKTDFQDNVTDSLVVPGLFYRITRNDNMQQYYLAEGIELDKDQVVKLSSNGSRLLQLSGFEYIEQIGLNPYDHSIVVIDRLGDQLILYDSGGNEISRSRANSFYDPIRIFIE